MAKKTLIPKSKATNAYELLAEVKALIVAEPRCYDQEDWSYHMDPHQPDAPPCGTVCCVGGWVEQLKPGQPSERTLGLGNGPNGEDQIDELFSSEALDRLDGVVPPCRTQGYAERGAEHITAFMQKYEAQLKAKAV